jgi:hypothetical protein
MTLDLTRNFLGWCTILNYVILIVWCLVFKLGHDWHYGITKRWFPISEEEYDKVNFRGVAIYKIAILLFNLVPYLALRLVG